MLNSVVALFNAGAAAAAGDYESIATVTVGSGGAADVEFTSIGTGWTHLQMRYVSGNTSDAFFVRAQFNSDTASNYSWHLLSGDGSSASAAADDTDNYMVFPRSATTISGTQYFNGGIVDILDYANINKYKTIRALGGYDRNGVGVVDFTSGSWRSTSAVSSMKLTSLSGNFAQYSHFALYGIKGA